jgi:hypothetical protein
MIKPTILLFLASSDQILKGKSPPLLNNTNRFSYDFSLVYSVTNFMNLLLTTIKWLIARANILKLGKAQKKDRDA